MKVIIAGGRDFTDSLLLSKSCNYLLQNYEGKNIRIISGMAKGADLLGVAYAEAKSYGVDKFPADWDLHGRSAGFIRNNEMAIVADALIAFWNGNSKGTANMIKIAREKGLKVKIIRY